MPEFRAAAEIATFHPTDLGLFFRKEDPLDPRLGQFARQWKIQSPEQIAQRLAAERPGAAAAADKQFKFRDVRRPFVLAGYADDEGIRLSGGRPGAVQAPPFVRRFLYKMTPSCLSDPDAAPDPAIFDIGDLRPSGETLAERHECARQAAFAALAGGATWLAIGGGHDYGYADASAFSDFCAREGQRPLTINIDAHLDVRPYVDSSNSAVYSSGTPFSRWLDAFPESDFAAIGLQALCNSRAHRSWLRARGGRLLFIEDLEASGQTLEAAALELLDEWVERRRKAFISIDIDAFSNAFAPGCSQSFSTGLTPAGFFPLLQTLLKRLDVRALAIYETSPPLDQDDRTSKLAAQILHRAIDPL